MEKAKQKTHERRIKILKCAREVFINDGYAAATMSQISEMAGGSKATLYNYYPSKKDLFLAVIEEECDRLMGGLFLFEDDSRDIFKVIRGFCYRLIHIVHQDDMLALTRLIIAESVRFPELGQAVYDAGYRPGMELVAKMLQMAIDQGKLRNANPRKGAELLLDLCQGFLQDCRLWGVRDQISEEEISDSAEQAAAIFLASFGTDETASAARKRIK